MTDNVVFMVTNAPRIHQEIIARLVYVLSDLLFKGTSKLFPYPETMIDEGQTSSVPDVMLVDRETDLTQVIIEITHTQGVKKDGRKLLSLMKDYEVPEGFVYDYKQQIWYRFTPDQEEAAESSYCEALGRDLATLLRIVN
jgi:Uma2 family endonuclease